MTLSELIERLQDLQESCREDVDPEVVLQYQPNYPMKVSVGNVRGAIDEGKPVVWLAEGTHLGYGDRRAWEGADGYEDEDEES